MKTFCLIVVVSTLISIGFDLLGSVLWVMIYETLRKEHRGDEE